jgi:hypothetical protein
MEYENRHVSRNVYILGVTLFLLIASLPIVVNGASAQDEPYSSEWLPWFDSEMGITSDIDTNTNRLSQKIDDLGNSHYLYVTNSDELIHLSDVSGVWESTLIYNGKVSTSAFDIDKYGNLHILFIAGEDFTNQDLVYRTNMGSEIIGKLFAESGNTPSITVDENMDVHIVYVESSSESNNETDDDDQPIRRLKYGVRNNNNQSWSFSFPNEGVWEYSVSNPVIESSESNVLVGFYEYNYHDDSGWAVSTLIKLEQNSWDLGVSDFVGEDFRPDGAGISIDATSDYYVITFKSHVDEGTVAVRVCQYEGGCSVHSIGAATNFEQPHDDRLTVPRPVVKVDDNNHVIHVFYVEYGLPALSTDGGHVYTQRVAIHWWCIEDCASTGATNPSQEIISWTSVYATEFIDAEFDIDRRGGEPLMMSSGFGTHRSSNQIGINNGSVVFAAIDYHNGGVLNLLHLEEKLNGCMDSKALNYDEEATIQTSYPHNEYVEICTYPIIESEEVPGFGIITLLLSIMIATITRYMKVEE